MNLELAMFIYDHSATHAKNSKARPLPVWASEHAYYPWSKIGHLFLWLDGHRFWQEAIYASNVGFVKQKAWCAHKHHIPNYFVSVHYEF